MSKIKKVLYFLGDHPVIAAILLYPIGLGISYLLLGRLALALPAFGFICELLILVPLIRWRRRIRNAEIKQDWIDYQARQTALELDKLQHPEKYQ